MEEPFRSSLEATRIQPRETTPGGLRGLERRRGIRALAVEGNRGDVPAAERGGVGVRGVGGNDGSVPHGCDDIDEAGELRRELYLWLRSQGAIQKEDDPGGEIPGERIRTARRARECVGVGGGLLERELSRSAE